MNEKELKDLRNEIAEIKEALARVETDLNWVKKFFIMISSAVIANLVGFIFILAKSALVFAK